jgi:hypothetical protein
MDEIVTERSEGILRVELNRPDKMNAMNSSMYIAGCEFQAPQKCRRLIMVYAISFIP